MNPRYRTGLKVVDVFPLKTDGTCACGCQAQLTGRQKRWSSKKCSRAAVLEFRIQKGDVQEIRKALFKRDKGVCVECKQKAQFWDADHTLAVVNGGGGCALDGYQTLCTDCHKKKTKLDLQERDQRRSGETGKLEQ